MEAHFKKESPHYDASIEEIKAHLGRIVTYDSLDTLTPKKVREELERALGLPLDSLKHRKSEINDVIDTIIFELKEGKSMRNSIECVEKRASTFLEINTKETHTSVKEQPDSPENNSPKAKLNEKVTKRKQVSMSVEEFLDKSQILSLTINGSNEKLAISPRQFSTGSVGWYYGGKVPLPIGNDLEVVCQVSVNCTVVGSKTWPQTQSKKQKLN